MNAVSPKTTMPRELQVTTEHIICDVCSRTMLKGEQAEPYLTPSRERKLVCALCAPRAQREGWIRESAAPETPTRPARRLERAGLLRRLRRGRAQPSPQAKRVEERVEPDLDVEPEPQPEPSGPAVGRSPRDERELLAVPTNAELKLDRAVEIFNESDHPRTIAGIARTLGAPYVSIVAAGGSSSEVLLTVAWELAWYQYAIDLSDRSEPVQLRARGEELGELPDAVRQWNAQARENGTMASGIVDAPSSDSAAEDTRL